MAMQLSIAQWLRERLRIADNLVNKLKEADIPCLKCLGVEIMPCDGSFF